MLRGYVALTLKIGLGTSVQNLPKEVSISST